MALIGISMKAIRSCRAILSRGALVVVARYMCMRRHLGPVGEQLIMPLGGFSFAEVAALGAVVGGANH